MGVVTNSWGTEPFDPYAGYHLRERFHAVVVSGEVGVRKPDQGIYLVAPEKVGVAAGACVLVDDVAANLPPAAELGMATIHQTDSAATVQQLERVFAIELH